MSCGQGEDDVPHRPLLLRMMAEHEEFEVETDCAGELAMPFWSETIRRVVAT